MNALTRHSFRSSPLSLAVPLEGTETTPGLRGLEKEVLTERLLSGTAASTSGGQHPSSGRSRSSPAFLGAQTGTQQHYEGPFLAQTNLEDLKAEPRRWSLFFVNGDKGLVREAYSLPRSIAALSDRTEENLVFYLPNYLRVLFAGLMLQFYLQPRALLAVAVLLLTLLTHLWALGAPPSTQGSFVSSMMPLFYIVAFVLAQRLRCFLVIMRWMTSCGTFMFLHASLRKAQSEHRQQARAAALQRMPLRLLRRRQQRQPDSEDQWALFREVAHLVKHQLATAAASLYVSAHSRWEAFVTLLGSISAWSPLQMLRGRRSRTALRPRHVRGWGPQRAGAAAEESSTGAGSGAAGSRRVPCTGLQGPRKAGAVPEGLAAGAGTGASGSRRVPAAGSTGALQAAGTSEGPAGGAGSGPEDSSRRVPVTKGLAGLFGKVQGSVQQPTGASWGASSLVQRTSPMM